MTKGHLDEALAASTFVPDDGPSEVHAIPKNDAEAAALLAGDPVNHPSHYTFGKIEVIEVIEDWQLGFHAGNIVKYIARAKHKGAELEDLQKAQWYLNRLIELKEQSNADVT